ncbi:hypothetical protein [Paenibacillus sp. sgz302251]|uniref:hypothetical protein n=1 Tax=Paenibacillus sp. sgz302251 TaxID=3414493 RepID=UPI003C7ABE3D
MSATTTQKQVAVEQLVPYLVYRHVTGENPSTDNMDNRIIWQKVGYFAKQLGMPFNEYNFSWYIRGPYSPAYTSILFSIKSNLKNILSSEEQFQLNEQASNKLTPLKRLIDNQPTGTSLSIWLELLASIHFIKNDTNTNKQQVYNKLIKEKPKLTDQVNFNNAWEMLKIEKLL